MKTTLVVMAAGMGSRFKSGIKQLTPVGDNGEILMEYSVRDAVNAGFDHIIYIIRKDIEKEFREATSFFDDKYNVMSNIVFQDLNDIPVKVNMEREKPWGTGHAVLAARDVIDSPFAVVNADDYYGANTYKLIHDFLVNNNSEKLMACMAGFILKNSIGSGNVNRAVCETNGDTLTKITETYNIVCENGKYTGEDYSHNKVDVDENALVSMNFFGFPKEIVDIFKGKFVTFLNELTPQDKKKEFSIPIILSEMVDNGEITMKVIKTPDETFGITHSEDLSSVAEKIKRING